MPLLVGNQIETSMTGSTEASKNNTRCSKKRTHAVLPEKRTTTSKKCKTVGGGENISRDSVVSLRTVESEIPKKTLERHSTCSKKSVGASVSNNVTSSKPSGAVSTLKVNS